MFPASEHASVPPACPQGRGAPCAGASWVASPPCGCVLVAVCWLLQLQQPPLQYPPCQQAALMLEAWG